MATPTCSAPPPARHSLAQRAMNSPSVAAIYQHIWRPIMVAAMSLHGISISAERERAAAALHLGGQQRVLDVACGPGNFTSFFADQLAGDGFVIGLDNSVPMMERAVRDNTCARAVYMRCSESMASTAKPSWWTVTGSKSSGVVPRVAATPRISTPGPISRRSAVDKAFRRREGTVVTGHRQRRHLLLADRPGGAARRGRRAHRRTRAGPRPSIVVVSTGMCAGSG
jgi:Methyltransferase domain